MIPTMITGVRGHEWGKAGERVLSALRYNT